MLLISANSQPSRYFSCLNSNLYFKGGYKKFDDLFTYKDNVIVACIGFDCGPGTEDSVICNPPSEKLIKLRNLFNLKKDFIYQSCKYQDEVCKYKGRHYKMFKNLKKEIKNRIKAKNDANIRDITLVLFYSGHGKASPSPHRHWFATPDEVSATSSKHPWVSLADIYNQIHNLANEGGVNRALIFVDSCRHIAYEKHSILKRGSDEFDYERHTEKNIVCSTFFGTFYDQAQISSYSKTDIIDSTIKIINTLPFLTTKGSINIKEYLDFLYTEIHEKSKHPAESLKGGLSNQPPDSNISEPFAASPIKHTNLNLIGIPKKAKYINVKNNTTSKTIKLPTKGKSKMNITIPESGTFTFTSLDNEGIEICSIKSEIQV